MVKLFLLKLTMPTFKEKKNLYYCSLALKDGGETGAEQSDRIRSDWRAKLSADFEANAVAQARGQQWVARSKRHDAKVHRAERHWMGTYNVEKEDVKEAIVEKSWRVTPGSGSTDTNGWRDDALWDRNGTRFEDHREVRGALDGDDGAVDGDDENGLEAVTTSDESRSSSEDEDGEDGDEVKPFHGSKYLSGSCGLDPAFVAVKSDDGTFKIAATVLQDLGYQVPVSSLANEFGDCLEDNQEPETDDGNENELCDFCRPRAQACCMKCLMGRSSKKVTRIGGNIFGFAD